MSTKHVAIFTLSEGFFLSHRVAIARGLHESGYKVSLITQSDGEDSKLGDYPFLKVYHVNFHPQKINPIESTLGILKVMMFLRKNDVDILHNYGIKPILFGSIAARLAGVARIFNTFTGLGILFSSQKRSRLTSLYKFLLKTLVFSSKKVQGIFQNAENMQLCVEQKIMQADQAHIIRGSGVNTDIFHPEPETDGPITFALASRLIQSKGVYEYLEAAKTVHEKHPDARFQVIGTEYQNGADPLDFDTASWKSQPYIDWKPHHANMVEVLHQAHVIVLPTYYGEGVPKILIEAASCGRPCITTDWPGCNDIIQNHHNGILVQPKSISELVDAMILLITDKSLRQKMGQAGRDRVLAHFSDQMVLERTIELYEGSTQ